MRKCVWFIRNLFQSIHQSFLRDEMLYSLILPTFITSCCNCIINHNLSVCALFGTALYSTLYVKLNCKRILIGSNLCSIGGNTHRWNHCSQHFDFFITYKKKWILCCCALVHFFVLTTFWHHPWSKTDYNIASKFV